ncbi:nitroreductase family protein [Halobacteria archaeon AArc-curdl1]|uniref:Nitroreductase family protein n=1 Tax=Natronosalvus hydrolyticus TaxID=2979988 RepID=A0AAP2ZC63_9EURY|nr:nitroreductase family protein [Halobacteria archaeon AArc-curdl1]
MSVEHGLWDESVPDLVDSLCRRATVRRFDPDGNIPPEELRAIIDAGRKAPTSGTTQAYSFLWLRNPETRARVHELCNRGSQQVEDASHFLLVCIDVRRNARLLDHRGEAFHLPREMGLLEGAIDAALAAQQTMVAAESRGYGVCPIGNILNGIYEITEELEIPEGVLPIFGLCIGIPRDQPRENCPRVPLEAVLHEETYDDADEQLLEACYDAMNQMYGDSVYGDDSREWHGTLARYWGPDGFMTRREADFSATLDRQGFGTLDGVYDSNPSLGSRNESCSVSTSGDDS